VKKERIPFNILHIFSPNGPHEEAYIAGTSIDLLRLGLSLIKAAIFKFSTASFFHSDGEGYSIFNISIPKDSGGNLFVPYTSEIFKDRNPDRFHPYQLMSFINGKHVYSRNKARRQ